MVNQCQSRVSLVIMLHSAAAHAGIVRMGRQQAHYSPHDATHSRMLADNDGSPLSLNSTDFIYLPSVAPRLTDTQGRGWPGNPAEAAGQLQTQCYDENKVHVQQGLDTCIKSVGVHKETHMHASRHVGS